MYKYKVQRVKTSGGLFKNLEWEDLELVINNLAKDGWRLVQVVSPPILTLWGTTSSAIFMDLIFEKQE